MALDETMGQAAEAGSLPSAVGLQVPSTPLDGATHAAGSALEAPSRGMDTSSGVVHPLETASEESERPSKQPRILLFLSRRMLSTPQHLMIVRLMSWKPATFRWTKS